MAFLGLEAHDIQVCHLSSLSPVDLLTAPPAPIPQYPQELALIFPPKYILNDFDAQVGHIPTIPAPDPSTVSEFLTTTVTHPDTQDSECQPRYPERTAPSPGQLRNARLPPTAFSLTPAP